VEKAVAAAKGKVAFVKVNIDDAGKLADREEVEYVPTMRLYRKGVETSQFEDEIEVALLKEWFAWFVAQEPAKPKRAARKR
jgi:thioredoxin-like negative regulator of GroEL